MTLNEILKDSAYKLAKFSPGQIQHLENSIIVIDARGKPTPEEAMRQLYLLVLMQNFGYPVGHIAVEYGVTFGQV